MKALLPLAALLAACATSPPEHPVGTQAGAESALALGFDPLEDTPLWRVGDHALFRVNLEAAGARTERWVRVEVLEATPSRDVYRFKAGGQERIYELPLLALSVDVYSDGGQLLSAERISVPDALLTTGFAPIGVATEHAWQTGVVSFDEQGRSVMFSWLALAAYLEIIQSSDALSSLFWQVVRRPPLWSLLGGVRVTVADPGRRSQPTALPLPAPIGSLPGWTVPLALKANGRLAVNLELRAVEAMPPLLITGGLISLVAKHPTREVVATIELMASRRGSGQGFLRDL